MSKKEGQRISKKEQRRQKLEREKRMKALKIWVPLGAIVIVLIAALLWRALEPEVEGITQVTAAASNQHDNDFRYEFSSMPPTGGIHNSTWLNCGIYTQPVEPEYAVHSMEHGAVWITYHPDLPTDEVVALQDMVRGGTYLILSPYPDQEANIVLTTWDIQLAVNSVSDDRIDEFIDRYKGVRGPEPGAACTGGVGNPIG